MMTTLPVPLSAPSQVPPEDHEAEAALLGCILMAAGEVMPRVRTLVSADDFTREPHAMVFRAIERLRERDEATAFGSVASELASTQETAHRWVVDLTTERKGRFEDVPTGRDLLELVGGRQFIAGLMEKVTHYLDAETYAKRVRFVATARGILSAATAAARVAYMEGDSRAEGDPTKLIAMAMAPFQKLVAQRAGGRIVSSDEAAHAYYATLTQRMEKDERVVGFALGFDGLDRYVAYRSGELMYVAANTGEGKTAFLGTLCDLLGDRGVPTLFVSIEQPLPQIMDRVLAGKTSIDSWKLARGNIDQHQLGAIGQALEPTAKRPIYYLEHGSLTTDELDAQVQYAMTRFGVRVVFLDYVQLMADVLPSHAGRAEVVAHISGRLRQIAARYGICLVAASQVSKEGNLRWAQELSQDAAVVLRLKRDVMKSKTEITIQKNRHSISGTTVTLHFDFASAHFWPMDRAERAGSVEQQEVPY